MLDEPTNLQVEELSQTELRVSWDAVTDADSYVVVLTNDNDDSVPSPPAQTVTVTEATFSGLVVDAFYVITVQAQQTDGTVSDKAKTFSFLSAILSPPDNIAFSKLSQSELRITWDAVGAADGYTVTFFGPDGAQIEQREQTATQADFSGLSVDTIYQVSVVATSTDPDLEPSVSSRAFAWITSQEKHSSAVHHLFADVQGRFQPFIFFRPFSKLMRPLREFPDYWRLVDNLSFVDGPDQNSGRFTFGGITWRGKINDSDPTLIEIVSEQGLGVKESVQHTDEVVSITVEFDQSGKFLLVFEDVNGLIWLDWFDPVPSERVTEQMEAGRTPAFASTRYDKRGGSGDSERVFFYVRASDDLVVFRRQSERWQTANPLPAAPGPVTELLNVGKTMYGGMLVAAAYEVSSGVVDTFYWNAPDTRGLVLNTDRDTIERLTLQPTGIVNTISAFDAINLVQPDIEQLSLSPSGIISDIIVETKESVIDSSPGGGLSIEQLTFSVSGIVSSILVETKSSTIGNDVTSDPGSGGGLSTDQLTLSNSVIINTVDVFESLILLNDPSILDETLTLSVSGTINSISVG